MKEKQHKENFRLIIPFYDRKQAKEVQELLKELKIDGNRVTIGSYIEDNR